MSPYYMFDCGWHFPFYMRVKPFVAERVLLFVCNKLGLRDCTYNTNYMYSTFLKLYLLCC